MVLTVLLSATLHGATAYPFARRYGAYAAEHEVPDGTGEPLDLPVRVRHTGG